MCTKSISTQPLPFRNTVLSAYHLSIPVDSTDVEKNRQSYSRLMTDRSGTSAAKSEHAYETWRRSSGFRSEKICNTGFPKPKNH